MFLAGLLVRWLIIFPPVFTTVLSPFSACEPPPPPVFQANHIPKGDLVDLIEYKLVGAGRVTYAVAYCLCFCSVVIKSFVPLLQLATPPPPPHSHPHPYPAFQSNHVPKENLVDYAVNWLGLVRVTCRFTCAVASSLLFFQFLI